jgi:predicted acetyltransferase
VSTSTLEIVHPVAAERLPGWLATMAGTFLEDPEGERTAKWVKNVERRFNPARSWGVRDRGAWVATLETEDRTLTVPGYDGATELVAADALTSVTVAATHRRRGLLTRMVTESLREARDRGDMVSMLISAEWPIYGRYGYAPAAFSAYRTLHRERRGATIAGDPTRLRQVTRKEYAAIAPAVFERTRRRRAGQVDRDQPWWEEKLGLDGWEVTRELPHNYLVHEGDAGPDGILAWTTKSEPQSWHPPLATVKVDALFAANEVAERNLWAYLTGLDLVDRVEVSGPVDEPANWLLSDARTLMVTEVADHLWVKLLDVPGALAARRYTVPGELVFEIIDESEVSAGGRVRLTADGDHAAAEPTAASPDLTLAQTALAAAYLGGVSLRGQLIAGTVTEHTPGALQRADAMFATGLAPFNATGF